MTIPYPWFALCLVVAVVLAAVDAPLRYYPPVAVLLVFVVLLSNLGGAR